MAAATMNDNIHPFPDSPMDPDEQAFPCKGCGEILEEGKAFELAGNRWHIDCFRCNTCNTLLDSDANLLLLGDGSLICNNCTYSCSSCGNKIEDLAILTGDQAFCANCFKCRNCKRKIENLRYARTSQGIFCMDCHEALMARRRKKTAKGGSSSKKTAHFDKSLPAIPPPEARHTAYIPQSHSAELPAEDVPMSTNVSAAAAAQPSAPSVLKTMSDLRGDTDSDNSRPATSSHNQQPGLTLAPTTYRDHRQSYTSQRSELSAGGEEFLIPLAFDPTPAKDSPPIHGAGHQASQSEDRAKDVASTPARTHASSLSYSTGLNSSTHQRSQTNEFTHNRYDSKTLRSDSNANPSYGSVDAQSSQNHSPHISQLARADAAKNDAKIPDLAKTRGPSTSSVTPQDKQLAFNRADSRGPDSRSNEDKDTPRMSYETSPDFTDGFNSPPQPSVSRPIPQRGDSLGNVTKPVTRKELPPSSLTYPPLGDNATTPGSKPQTPMDLAKANGGKVISAPISSPGSQSIYDTPELPDEEASTGVKFVQPRPPPAPPAGSHVRNESISTLQSDAQRSPKLPTYAGQGDFTLEEDISRILGLDEPTASESFLRRVSNSVRHGRSYSDRSGRFSRDKWPKSPGLQSGAHEIGSPPTASPEHREELAWFKNELRKERQKTMDRERKITELESHLNAAGEISQVNVELREKRSTMVVLDTQKEIVVRELEVLTEHIANAKASGQPFDMNKMTSAVLRDLADSLEKLKRSFTPQIENLVQQKSDLLDQITQLNQQKDKSFHEFEQLSNKNAQLAEFNNQLVDQIQNIYKSNSGNGVSEIKQPSGLGIYAHHKDNSKVSIDDRGARPSISAGGQITDPGMTYEAGEAGSIQTVGGAQVVEMKKGAVAKRFDWRRGQKMAKGLTKGVKGAFTSAQQNYNNGMAFAETGAYGIQTPGSEYGQSRNDLDPKQGWFGNNNNNNNNKPGPGRNGLYANSANASTPSLVADAGGAVPLFGTELKVRAEFEKQSIPGIVKRCIAEVETRGMDVEGIYRKSGGNSQVVQVKEGFEKQPYDYDISDPDLDIHAVTSGLKQYFRKLPTPLITYDVYDILIELTKIPEGPNQREQRIQGMQEALAVLPQVHYDILEYLMAHLARVVVLEKENLMTPMNVAVVFAPTIMRPESVARELSDTKAKNEVVMWMVNDGERVFGKS